VQHCGSARLCGPGVLPPEAVVPAEANHRCGGACARGAEVVAVVAVVVVVVVVLAVVVNVIVVVIVIVIVLGL